MQLNTSNNNTFTGAFRVARVTPQIKQEFQKYTSEGCKVFYNFSEKGDAFLVAHDRLNKEIQSFLKKVCKKDFTFWGNLTPKNCKSQEYTKTVLKYSSLPGAKNRIFSKWDAIDTELKHLKDIGFEINTDEAKLSMYRGVMQINDVANERKLLLSPKKLGTTYLKVYPYSKSQSAEYLMINSGNWSDSIATVQKRYRTADEIMEFNKFFNAAKKSYDPDFMSKYPEGRTNFELLAKNIYEDEKFFNNVANKSPEIAKALCYDATFVPTSIALRFFDWSESPEQAIRDYGKYLQRNYK